jgi:hypothetical protein
MDVLSRCEAELHEGRKLREVVRALGSLVESQPCSRRAAALHRELVALEGTLARRLREVVARAAEFEVTDVGLEELELETGLAAHLEGKMLHLSELLKRELDRPRSTLPYEEPLG